MGRIKENQFLLLGISHKTAPVEVRERVSFEPGSCGQILNDIHELKGIHDCVLLSTCNRTEIYAAVSEKPAAVRDRLISLLLETADIGNDTLDCFYTLTGRRVIEHLFHVVAGLDSMIFGENQIFGQVKDAYAEACDLNCTGPAFNRLFHHAFRVGKMIRSLTAIGEGAVSVSYAAVELARNIFDDLADGTVLLIGAGKMGELSAQRLIDIGVNNLIIANRTHERAVELAEKLNGSPIGLDEIPQAIETADIVIASVAAGKPIITRDMLEDGIGSRNGRPLMLIDLGVPRNIDPDAGDFDDVTLYNIDDLEGLTLDNLDRRKSEAEKAEDIIESQVNDYCEWLSERELIPAIRTMHATCENIRLDEIERVKNRVDPEALELIDLVTRRVVRKILHTPMIKIRESDAGEQREHMLNTVRKLFNDDAE